MTEADTSYTSVLLPGSRVAMFANDAGSVDSFNALQNDWRFARVQMEHRPGGVDAAIAALKAGTVTPDLIIIETDTIDDGFTEKLETLAAHCPEGTAAIVIGPVNDVNLYRRLIGMGISDYLVRPVKVEALSFDVARSLIERLGATGSRLIAMIGAKGGVGTTILSQALAWGTADVLHQKTVLVDAAGGWSTLSIGMNFEPATTLIEAVRASASQNEDAFRRMLFQASDKLHVLSSGGDVMLEDSVDSAGYEMLIDALMKTYPVVIVDLSNSPTMLQRVILSRAHEIVLLTTPLLPSLRAARTLIQEIRDIRGDADKCLDLIVNMTGLAPKHEVSKNDLEQALERKPAITISFNPALFPAVENEGRKLHSVQEGNHVTRNLLSLVSKVLAGTGSDVAMIDSDGHGKKKRFNSLFSKLKDKS
ncbi:MAG TPA: AAA family ATPase [Micavibrio sp.]|jgi:pilus assembly protein CpaE